MVICYTWEHTWNSMLGNRVPLQNDGNTFKNFKASAFKEFLHFYSPI